MCLMCTYPYSMWPFLENRGEERREERREEWVLLPPAPKTYKSEVVAPDRDTRRLRACGRIGQVV